MPLNLPTAAEVEAGRVGKPILKGEPRKRTKRRKDRLETAIKRIVRDAVANRDGYCRISKDTIAQCQGPSEWAHWGDRKRFKTRGMAPELRHTTGGSFMACRRHHDQFDGRATPRLQIVALTDKGCDGPLRYERPE